MLSRILHPGALTYLKSLPSRVLQQWYLRVQQAELLQNSYLVYSHLDHSAAGHDASLHVDDESRLILSFQRSTPSIAYQCGEVDMRL